MSETVSVGDTKSVGKKKKGVLSFSGGKDCHLALIRAIESGIEITHLVTFANSSSPKFLAHPYEIMMAQSEMLKIPLVIKKIEKPFKQNYVIAILSLHEEYGTEIVVTGDMTYVCGDSDWMTECCSLTNGKVSVFQPLWDIEREKMLAELQERKIVAMLTCVKSPPFDESWIGRILDSSFVEDLKSSLPEGSKGFDICGEEGHYHTMVISHPLYADDISIKNFEVKKTNNLYHLVPK